VVSQSNIISPKYYDKRLLFVFGLCLMIMNKIRHSLSRSEYLSPRPFSHLNIRKNVRYCVNVVQKWVEILKVYTNQSHPFQKKSVLEVGPGPDLGTGLIILALGADTYTAIDKHHLVSQAPKEFYELLLSKLRKFPSYERAETAYQSFLKGKFIKQFRYIHEPAFPRFFPKLNEKYDIVVSQAVLEHFSETEVRLFFKEISKNLSQKAKTLHEIDLATHTRLLRELDPLNILRYPDLIWNALRFNGSPNRSRMSDYRFILEELGYLNIDCHPLRMLDLSYVNKMRESLSLYKRFRKYSDEDLSVLLFCLLAERD